jgi:transcriptional regulator with XRE-family HTH domain
MQTMMISEERGLLNIAENVRRLMALRKMTQIDVARAAGVSQPFIHRILEGTSNPNAIALRNVAEALGTTSDALIDNPKEEISKKTA